MSNYLTEEYKITNPPQLGDVQLARTVLSTLQGRYDAAKSQIDQTLALYDQNLKGLKESDDQYIAQKIKLVKSQVDLLSKKNGNLAYSYNRDNIMSTIQTVLQDPIVQDAVTSRANYNNYNSQIAKLQEKNPSQVSNANYAYGLYKAGYQDYMEGKTKKLGSIQYTPNVDYRKELKDVAENIDKYDTDIKKAWTENGYIYTKEGKQITAEKIKNIAENFLTDGAKKQMVIDGFASIHQGNTEEERLANTISAFQQYKTNTLSSEKENLSYYQAQAKKTGSVEDKNNAKQAEENYANIAKRLDDIQNSGNAEQMFGTVYKESTLNNFSKTFAYNTVDITNISGDTTYMANVKMAYERERDSIKDAQWQANYDLALQKAFPNSGGQVFQTKSGFDNTVEDAGNIQEQAFQEIEGLNGAITEKVNALYSNLDETTQEGIDLEVKNSKGMKSREDVLIEYYEGGTVSNADAKELNDLVTSRYAKQGEYVKYKQEVEKEAEKKLDSPELIKRLFNNPDIKIMWPGSESGKERAYSAKEVLIANGMVDENGNRTKTNPKVIQAIKKSMLADKILSTGEGQQKTQYIKNLALVMGEDPNKVYVKTGRGSMQGSPLTVGTSGQSFDTFQINPNSKTGQFILEQQRQGGSNRAGIFSKDDSFDDIPEVNSYLAETNPVNINRRIGEKIMNNKTTAFGLITTVMPGTVEYAQIAQNVGFDIKSNIPIEMKHVPNQPNMLYVTLGRGSSSKIKPTSTPNIETIRVEDLHPNVLKQVDFYNTKSKLNVNNFPPMKQKATFTDKTGTALTAFAGEFYGGKDEVSVNRASLTTKTGASDYYFRNYSNILGTEAKPTEVGNAIKSIINSNDTYVETQITKEGDERYIIPIIKKGDVEVYVPKATQENLITNENADSVQRTIKFTPQDYINRYVTAVLQSQDQNQIDKLVRIYGQ